MAQLIIFDLQTGEIIDSFLNGGFSPPDYVRRKDVLFDPDLTKLEGVIPKQFWRVDVSTLTVVEKSQVEKDTILAAEAAKIQKEIDLRQVVKQNLMTAKPFDDEQAEWLLRKL